MNRFWSKVNKTAPNGCWEWTAYKRGNGYGSFGFEGRMLYAHRFSYELLIGPIPEGLQLDHLCRNRACVNPDHLEPVTCKINVLRGTNFSALNAVKTQCPCGHEYTEENTLIIPNGGRVCRQCKRRRDAEYRAKLRNVTRFA